MVLSTLLFVLGFCCAALCGLAFVPFIWARAARLTRQRVEDALPLSLKDIEADRDELRAEFAVAARRLEQQTEKVRGSETSVRMQNGKYLAQIDAMTATLADRDERIENFEDLSARQSDEIEQLDADLGQTRSDLTDARDQIASLDDNVAALNSTVADSKAEIDGQRVEIVALKTQSDNLSQLLSIKTSDHEAMTQRFEDAEAARRTGTARIATLERALQGKERETKRQAERLSRIENDHAATVRRLRADIEKASLKARDLESQITIQAAESMRQGKRSTTLESQFSSAADEIARMEALVRDTERRAAAQIEEARATLMAERNRRHAVARELAELRGIPYIEPKDSDATPIRPFQSTSPQGPAPTLAPKDTHPVNGRQSQVAKVRVAADRLTATGAGSRVVKVGLPGMAVQNDTGKATVPRRSSIAGRVSRLKAELSTVPGTGDADSTQSGTLFDKLTDGELQSRIKDLANRYASFDTEDDTGSGGANHAEPDTAKQSVKA